MAMRRGEDVVVIILRIVILMPAFGMKENLDKCERKDQERKATGSWESRMEVSCTCAASIESAKRTQSCASEGKFGFFGQFFQAHQSFADWPCQ